MASIFEGPIFDGPLVRNNFNKIMHERIYDAKHNHPLGFSVEELCNIHKNLYDGFSESRGLPTLDNYSFKYSPTLSTELYNVFLSRLYIINYSELDRESVINNIALFISEIYRLHPFLYGNTRTIAIFVKNFLELQGFEVDIDKFVDNFDEFKNNVQIASAIYFKKKETSVEYDGLINFLDDIISKERTYNTGYRTHNHK